MKSKECIEIGIMFLEKVSGFPIMFRHSNCSWKLKKTYIRYPFVVFVGARRFILHDTGC